MMPKSLPNGLKFSGSRGGAVPTRLHTRAPMNELGVSPFFNKYWSVVWPCSWDASFSAGCVVGHFVFIVVKLFVYMVLNGCWCVGRSNQFDCLCGSCDTDVNAQEYDG